MPRKPHLAGELATIAWLAPFVIADRMQRLGWTGTPPPAAARREWMRMTVEKPLAVVSAALAFNAGMMKLWAEGASAFSMLPMQAALVPVRRRVQANRRRLGRR